jgi:hypothetical protein
MAVFSDTEDGCMLWRIHVEADNIRRFGFELGIVRQNIVLDSVRLQTGTLPYSRHSHMIDSQLPTQFTGAPVCRTIHRFALRSRQNLCLQLRRILVRCATQMPRVQPRKAVGVKALLPSADVAAIVRVESYFPLFRFVTFGRSTSIRHPRDGTRV